MVNQPGRAVPLLELAAEDLQRPADERRSGGHRPVADQADLRGVYPHLRGFFQDGEKHRRNEQGRRDAVFLGEIEEAAGVEVSVRPHHGCAIDEVMSDPKWCELREYFCPGCCCPARSRSGCPGLPCPLHVQA